MNLRLILFILLGIVVYIQLALFNGRMLARIDAAVPKPPPCSSELSASAPAASLQAPVETVAQLKERLAHKEEQINNLLDAHEAIGAKVQALEVEAARGEKDQEIERLTDELGKRSRLLVEAQEGIDARNQQMEELRGTIADLQLQVEGLQVEREELMGNLGRLQEEAHAAAEKQSAGEALQLQLQQQVSDKDQRLRDLEAQAQELGALLAASSAKSEDVERQLQALQAGKTEREQLVDRVQDENQRLKAQLADSQALLAASKEKEQVQAQLTAELKQAQETLAGTESRLNERQTALEQLGASNKALEEQLQAEQAGRQEQIGRIQELERDVATHPQAIAAVQRQLDERSAMLGQSEERVAELQAKTEQMGQQLATAQEKIAELEPWQVEGGKLREQLQGAQDAQKELQLQLNEKNGELKRLQAEVLEQQKHLAGFADERTGLTSRIKTLQEYSKDYLNLKAALDTKTAALSQAEQKIEGLNPLQGQVQELQAKNKDLADMVAVKDQALAKQTELEAQTTKLNEEFAALQKKTEELNTQKAEQAKQIAGLEQEKTDLENRLAAVPDIDTLKQQINEGLQRQQELEGQLATQKESLAKQGEMQALLDQSGAEAQKAREAFAALKTEKDSLQETLNTSQVQLTELRGQIAVLEKTIADNATRAHDTAQYEERISTLQADKEALQKSLTEGQGAVQALQEQLQSLQQERAAEKAQAQEVLDQCKAEAQATPPPATAAPVELPDRDGDGVADSLDLCPDSAAGATVNHLGCTPDAGIVLEGVVFATGSNVLTADARQRLDRVVEGLTQQPQLKAEVAGYTDSRGNAEANRQLSQRRAEAVVTYLVEKGIAGERLSARGYGQDNPIASNANEAGRQRNRRVELHLEGM